MSTTVAQLERLIHQAGYIEIRKQNGSHHHYRHSVTGAKLTVAFRKGKRLSPGTLSQIEEQMRAGAQAHQRKKVA